MLLLASILGISQGLMDVPISVVLVFALFMMRLAPKIGQLQHNIQTYNQRCDAFGIVTRSIEETERAQEFLNPTGFAFKTLNDAICLNNVTFSYADGKAART